MVVVGTKPEYLNAVWVKNEWSRYLALMRTDRSRLLIPCYRDMDPYDMPEELSMLQSQDMGKIGFIQDLIRGVKKVVDAAKPQEAAAETVKETVVVHNEGGSNVQALLKRGNMALEDGEWSKADEFFEQVLNQDAECGAAYLGKFLARVECRSAKTYADAYIENVKDDAPGEKNAYACEEDEAFAAACVEKYTLRGILSAVQIREALDFDLGYCVTSDYYALRAEEAQEQFAADKDLMRATKYASSEAKTITEDIPQTLDKLRADAQKREDAEKARITADYRKFLTETEAKLEEEHPQRLKEAEEARKAEADRQRKAKAAEKKIAIVAGIATAVIALVLVVVNVIIPAVNYSKAEKYLAAGDYDNAITTFTNLGNYKDAVEQLAQTRALKEEAEEEARNARAYANAEELLANEDYDGAIAAFKKLGDYQDAANRAEDAEAQKVETESAQIYQEAISMKESGDYNEAVDAFATLGNYLDALDQVNECQYLMADQLQAQGETAKAAIAFGKLIGYKDAKERSFALWHINSIMASCDNTIGLQADGKVVVAGQNSNRFLSTSDWADIVSVSVADQHIVGLKADGTVVAAGTEQEDVCDVSEWSDIVEISTNSFHTVGLKADGTVVATGQNNEGQCNVSSWTNIVAISTGQFHTVGLKADGTVIATKFTADSTFFPYAGQCDVSNWNNIASVLARGSRTIGLKTDGTVVAAGSNCDVSGWTDIAALEMGQDCTIGLKKDGTVVAIWEESHRLDGTAVVAANDIKNYLHEVNSWSNIIAVAAGDGFVVGVKRDGTVVAVGINTDGQCNVNSWTDIVAIASGSKYTVGLKADGTVVAVGNNSYGQCNVSEWTDIMIPHTH